MKRTQEANDAQAGEIRLIDGELRIAKVGFRNLPDGDYEMCLRWYLPKTREDSLVLYRYQQEERKKK